MMSRPVADNCAATGRFLFGGSMSTDLTTLVLPDGELVTEPPVLAEYRLNPYTQETAAEGQPIAVVFATSVADVQATLQFATAHHIPVVTQGARTSISNGAAGLDGSILLNLSRLNHIVALQPENQTAVVEAGVLNGDLDQAAREVGYLFGQYKRLKSTYEGVLTGKGLTFGGSLARTEATGYGLLYLVEELLKDHGKDLKDKVVTVSGAGNVAIYAIEKAQQLGAKVVTCSDSNGWVYDPEGIDVELLKDVKEVKRQRLTEYAARRESAQYHEGRGVWSVKADVALPCATQNELDLDDAKNLVANGVLAVCEGANMPTTLDATKYLQENGVLFVPGKASNAGGVAVSALEMSQNSERLSWSFEEVDGKLKDIMVNIYHNIDEAAKKYGLDGDYVAGANIAGFLKVAEAMEAQGVV